MKHTSYLFLILVLKFIFVNGSKIQGGRFAKEGEFPSAVCLLGIRQCGGALVTLSKIVTAGHCYNFDGELEDLDKLIVVGGTIKSETQTGGYQSRRVTKFHLHEKFKKKNDETDAHDIATGDLHKPFELSETLKPLRIVSSDPEEFKKSWDKIVADGTSCTSVGWGLMNEKDLAPFLKAAEMVFWTQETCAKTEAAGDDMSKFGEVCSKPLIPKEGTCSGDGGSPLYCGEYAYGIALSEPKCGKADVYYYLLFWNYIDYFGLDVAAAQSTRHCPMHSIFVYHMILIINYII